MVYIYVLSRLDIIVTNHELHYNKSGSVYLQMNLQIIRNWNTI